MLKYSLRENLLTPEPDDCMGSQPAVAYRVCRMANSRGYPCEFFPGMTRRGTTLTKADVSAVLQVFSEVVCELTADGSAVNTPLFSVSGVFSGMADSFDRARHMVSVNVNPGTALREAAKSVRTEKTEAASTGPYITEATDVVSGSVNSTLTAGGILRLIGSRLKFDASDETQGVFLILADGGEAVKCAVVAENKPARVMVMVPADVKPDAYYVEVRTKLDASRQPGKRLKACRYAKPLTVSSGS
ncbi:MAG: DUF4469 domain-containing protein [Treponema sp.]|nr:DUF4469 domain-containing protein [Treponema sp.]